jgi:SAM-dependent methyltransferase
MADYIWANAWERERHRLNLVEATEDPGSIRLLAALGVRRGWRCLEVGGGGGSIATWLCRRVGTAGVVTATDLDPRFLETLDAPNLQVLRHDITCDPLPEGAFDLIHSRWLLHHLPDPAAAIRRLTAALRPGGWLLVEEPDIVSVAADTRDPTEEEYAAPLAAFFEAMAAFLAGRGGNYRYGRRLLRDLDAADLESIETEARSRMVHGGTATAEQVQLALEQLRAPLIAAGLLRPAMVETILTRFADPTFTWLGWVTVAAWGRRPLEPQPAARRESV